MKFPCLKLAALVLATATAMAAAEKKSVVMFAGGSSHGPGEHQHNAGVLLLAKCLRENAAELPAKGIESKVTPADMQENLDDKGQHRERKPAASQARVTPGVCYGCEEANRLMNGSETPPGLAASRFAAEPIVP